jgi:hypothetical protein
LRLVSVFFAQAARPQIQVLRDFIAQHRDTYGVEPISKVLQIPFVWLSTLCCTAEEYYLFHRFDFELFPVTLAAHSSS